VADRHERLAARAARPFRNWIATTGGVQTLAVALAGYTETDSVIRYRIPTCRGCHVVANQAYPVGRAWIQRDTGRAMSQENVEVVRRTMDAYNTRDLPAYFDTLSESVRFESRFSAMDRVYCGHDDLRRYFAELDEVWSRYEMRVQRLVPAGRQVAALCHLYAVGRESDLQVEEDSAVVFTVEAGKIVQIDAYPTHAEALEAAGLRE
jgi:ketosteroid isomerase-like protein